MAHDINQTSYSVYQSRLWLRWAKPKHTYESCAIPEEMFEEIRKIVPPQEMEEAVFTDVKQVREENIRQITAKSWRRPSRRRKTGWLCWMRRYTSTRRRQSAR